MLREAKSDEELLLMEHTNIGVSHDTLGAALCESWGLAPPAVDSVRYHVVVNGAWSCRCMCSDARSARCRRWRTPS